MSAKGPETWLSRGLENSASRPGEAGPFFEASNVLPGQVDEPAQQSPKSRDEFVQGAIENSDPYLMVSSHWMAPGKSFLKASSADAIAKRDHLIKIETERALAEKLEIERLERPEVSLEEIV